MAYNSKYTGSEVDNALSKALTAIQEHQDISGKQDVISDLDEIRANSKKGATALQSVPSEYVTETELNAKGYTTNVGTITGIKMNGASKGTSGVVDLGTVITSHQDISGKVDKVSGKGLSTNDYTTLEKTKLGYTNIAYGTCDTAAATAEKAITVSGNTNWELQVGSIIVVKFANSNTAQNPTFNVNGKGGKPVWYNTAIITTSSLSYAGYKNRPMEFMYDGTQFVFIGWSVDSNSTYSTYSLGIGYGTCDTAASTVAKVVTLSNYSLVVGGIVSVKFTYDVPASATMNINSKGAKAVYHKGAAIKAGVIKAGDTATFIYSTYYYLIAIDRATSTATTTTDGLMSSSDKTKLEGVATTYATKTEVNNKQDKVLKFTNKSASTWVSDSTYSSFPYRCDISCSGVTSDMFAEVVFSLNESINGMYAPLCETKTNVVSIWSMINVSIIIPTIIITK